jgi:hypothetical protein
VRRNESLESRTPVGRPVQLTRHIHVACDNQGVEREVFDAIRHSHALLIFYPNAIPPSSNHKEKTSLVLWKLQELNSKSPKTLRSRGSHHSHGHQDIQSPSALAPHDCASLLEKRPRVRFC